MCVCVCVVFLFCFVLFCLLFRATVYGSSQVRGQDQLPTCATATAMPDPSHICDLRHSSLQLWIPDPLSEARDRTCKLMDISWICSHYATTGTSNSCILVHEKKFTIIYPVPYTDILRPPHPVCSFFGFYCKKQITPQWLSFRVCRKTSWK